eukprot:7130218-Prymnesium_polylepis.1
MVPLSTTSSCNTPTRRLSRERWVRGCTCTPALATTSPSGGVDATSYETCAPLLPRPRDSASGETWGVKEMGLPFKKGGAG